MSAIGDELLLFVKLLIKKTLEFKEIFLDKNLERWRGGWRSRETGGLKEENSDGKQKSFDVEWNYR